MLGLLRLASHSHRLVAIMSEQLPAEIAPASRLPTTAEFRRLASGGDRHRSGLTPALQVAREGGGFVPRPVVGHRGFDARTEERTSNPVRRPAESHGVDHSRDEYQAQCTVVARRAFSTMGLGTVCSTPAELQSLPSWTDDVLDERPDTCMIVRMPMVSATGAPRTGQSGPPAKLQEVARS